MGIQHNRVNGSSVSERFSQNNKLPFQLAIDPVTGDYGYIKDGADAVTPFSNGLPIVELIFPNYASGYRATVWNSDGYWSNDEYSRAAEPPVRCGESHVSGLTGATLL